MGVKSKLALGLAAEKGIDIGKIKEKRRLKALHRKKEGKKQHTKTIAEEQPDDDNDEWEGGDNESRNFDPEALNDSCSSDSEVEMEERIERPKSAMTKRGALKPANGANPAAAKDEDEEDEDDDEDIPMSDIEELDDADKEDLIAHSRLTINNTSALLTSLNRIKLPTDPSVAFASHQSVSSKEPTADAIPDVSDDLQRELQFYKQSRDAVVKARTLLRSEGVLFSRPTDVSSHILKITTQTVRLRPLPC